MRVEFYQDDAGEFRFRIVAKNNKILAVSSEGYKNSEDCFKAFELIIGAFRLGHYKIVGL